MLRSVWFWFAAVCTVLLMIPVSFSAPLPMVLAFNSPGSVGAVWQQSQRLRLQLPEKPPVIGAPAGLDPALPIPLAAKPTLLLIPELLPADLPVLAETDAQKAMTPELPSKDTHNQGLLLLSELARGAAKDDADTMHLARLCGGAKPSAYLVTRNEPDNCPAP
jgi:hypothetical protein